MAILLKCDAPGCCTTAPIHVVSVCGEPTFWPPPGWICRDGNARDIDQMEAAWLCPEHGPVDGRTVDR